MQCLSGRQVVSKDGSVETVRCGKCLPCLKARRRVWVGRLMLESASHKWSRFLTLTYAKAPLAIDMNEFSLFMKRYRHFYGPCRFVGIGEYGDKLKRPHFHAIIFGHRPYTIGHWTDNQAWTYGYSYDGEAGPKAIGYVCAYAVKAFGTPRSAHARFSNRPGIGAAQLEALGAKHAQQLGGNVLLSWPAAYRIGNSHYPFGKTGHEYFKKGFLNEGGLMPVRETLKLQGYVVADWLSDRGSFIQRDRHYTQEWFNDKYGYLNVS